MVYMSSESIHVGITLKDPCCKLSSVVMSEWCSYNDDDDDNNNNNNSTNYNTYVKRSVSCIESIGLNTRRDDS